MLGNSPATHDVEDETRTRTSAGVSFAARLAFENVGHIVGSTTILNGISLVAEPGEILCLLGPSGSGKTTMLRIAAGIERQTHGRLLLNGREIAGPHEFVPPEKRGVGLMFQDFALFPHMTILDNVRFGLSALSGPAAKREALAGLKRVGLDHAAMSYPHMLSGGEQQRVALARALSPRPSVLLMDEPFSGLDSRLKDVVRTDTLQILRESHATAIIVTHDAEEAMRLGDRIALIRDGQLVQSGTAAELYGKPANLFAAGFFSELNIIDGEVRGGRVVTPLGPVAESPCPDGTPMTVALRLTGLRLNESENGVFGRIVSRRFLGGVDLMTVAVEGVELPLRSRMRAGLVAETQRDVVVSVDPQDVIVFEKTPEDR